MALTRAALYAGECGPRAKCFPKRKASIAARAQARNAGQYWPRNVLGDCAQASLSRKSRARACGNPENAKKAGLHHIEFHRAGRTVACIVQLRYLHMAEPLSDCAGRASQPVAPTLPPPNVVLQEALDYLQALQQVQRLRRRQ